MITALMIYFRAVGLYALLTLPLMVSPPVYVTSLVYVLIYGWFACFVFTGFCLIIDKLVFDFAIRVGALFISVGIAVSFAYYMIGILSAGESIWHSGYVIFPFAAVIAGWISVCLSHERIRRSCYAEENDHVF